MFPKYLNFSVGYLHVPPLIHFAPIHHNTITDEW